MCVALPGQLLEIVDPDRRLGRVEVLGVTRLVNLALLDDPAPGDWVLIQTGFAVEKVDEATARETLDFLRALEADAAAGLSADDTSP
ncbi:MAG: HypC/HybG/HupF family hydrogenase formation chaperone [Armatimonadota bacterium]|nr:HypC/HybG/HupF family hydrogenase formation chaperone [Armatimonadota bacterium]